MASRAGRLPARSWTASRAACSAPTRPPPMPRARRRTARPGPAPERAFHRPCPAAPPAPSLRGKILVAGIAVERPEVAIRARARWLGAREGRGQNLAKTRRRRGRRDGGASRHRKNRRTLRVSAPARAFAIEQRRGPVGSYPRHGRGTRAARRLVARANSTSGSRARSSGERPRNKSAFAQTHKPRSPRRGCRPPPAAAPSTTAPYGRRSARRLDTTLILRHAVLRQAGQQPATA